MIINQEIFFETVREDLFNGSLSQSQVDGLNEIMGYFEKYHNDLPLTQLAYILATAYHETGRKMQPINEWGSDSYFFKMYDIEGNRPHVAKRLGNTEPGDGILFHGRGYVQITGRRNYQYWKTRMNLDFISDPDLTMKDGNAVHILVEGMVDGTFTGRKLSKYINTEKTDYVSARMIINGRDKSKTIASYAKKFEEALFTEEVSE